MPAQSKRPARPRRRQFDGRHHDSANAVEAAKVLADPSAPAGLREWAERFQERQARENPRCCLCGQPAFSSVAVLCRACHRKPTFSALEQQCIAEARAQREQNGTSSNLLGGQP